MDRAERRDVWILFGLMAVGLALRVAYVLATSGFELAGDAPEYHAEGRLIADGMWFHTTLPYGVLHEGMWKAPGYPAFVGVIYALLGVDVTTVLLVQCLVGPLTIYLVWRLGRRLFDGRLALVAAGVAAVYPHMWQWEVRLYPEGLALPFALGVMILALEREPTRGRAALVGLAMGVGMLIRPTQFFLFALVAVAWWISAGPRRGLGLAAVSVLVAGLTIAPWTVRNYVVADAFIPISMQDAAAYGTFNDESKNDERFPWAWRASTTRDRDLFDRSNPLPDGELRARLQDRAREYIVENPLSVPKAFFWNGVTRLWDLRRPSNALAEVPFDGRVRWVSWIGLVAYWALLAAALVALWRLRRRRALVLPVLAAALAASVVFTTVSASRYRLPFEPLIVLLALSVLLPWLDRLRARTAQNWVPS